MMTSKDKKTEVLIILPVFIYRNRIILLLQNQGPNNKTIKNEQKLLYK